MSGSFMDLDVPPTLISFAIAPIDKEQVLTPEFKEAGNPVYVFGPTDETAESQKQAWESFHELHLAGKVKSAWAVENGLGEAVMKMSFGNRIGFKSCGTVGGDWHTNLYAFIVAELTEEVDLPSAMKIGDTTEEAAIVLERESVSIDELLAINEGVLEGVYSTFVDEGKKEIVRKIQEARDRL